MKRLLFAALVAAFATTASGVVLDISTGIAGWQVRLPGAASSVAATTLTAGQQNGTWAPAPAGSSWISWSPVQGTSCVVGHTPGNGCANTLVSGAGDSFLYTLTISAAALTTTSGTLNFLLGADNRVNLVVGVGGINQLVNGGSNTNGSGYNPLGCSNTAGPTNGGNTQAQYTTCATAVAFNSGNLNGDGSLTLAATVNNDLISGCPTCGDPTGFLLKGTLTTNAVHIVDLSTGIANWQVLIPGAGSSVAATTLTAGQQNGTWAPAPTGSSWVSWGSIQGTSCVVGQTPGNGCANTLINSGGDSYLYTLTIPAAALAGTSGNLKLLLGADNRVNLVAGVGGINQLVNGGSNTNGTGYNPLGCSNAAGPTSGGNTQAQYNACATTVSFNAGNLNGDGSLTLSATVHNDPIPACPTCGDPTGFLLKGVLTPNVANVVDISTGVANWQVLVPGTVNSVPPATLTASQQNGTWAPAPAGSSWVSYSPVQGTSCVVGQTPGNGCANTLISGGGDSFLYTLTIPAATLAATSGTLNFLLGADSRVNLVAGVGGISQVVNGGSNTNGSGYNPLGCSNNPGPTNGGNTQAQYNTCLSTLSFNAGNLNGDGSLTLSATVNNDPIPACPTCGDPTGFILRGTLTTNPATLDIDRSSAATKYDAPTDGLLIVRYLLGLTGTALTNGATGGTATRLDPVAIKNYLDGMRALLDIDGNGNVDALTDGFLIVRYLAGLRGTALVTGAVGALPGRNTAQIETYIQSLMP